MFVPMRLSDENLKALEAINDADKKKMRETCVSAILVLAQNGAPIKKTDLNRLVLSGTRHYRMVQAITVEANKELHRILGMRLYEMDDKSKYLLVNSNTEYSSYPKRNQSSYEEFTVLYFILMDIFATSEEKIKEQDMMNTLGALDIEEKSLKKHIDNLMKKLYIVQAKDELNPENKLFAWGPRAEAEIDPDKFFDSFLALTHDPRKDYWPDQKRRIEMLKAIPNRNIILVTPSQPQALSNSQARTPRSQAPPSQIRTSQRRSARLS